MFPLNAYCFKDKFEVCHGFPFPAIILGIWFREINSIAARKSLQNILHKCAASWDLISSSLWYTCQILRNSDFVGTRAGKSRLWQ